VGVLLILSTQYGMQVHLAVITVIILTMLVKHVCVA